MNTRMTRLLGVALMTMAASILICVPTAIADFTYQPPGELVSGSGTGRVDSTVYVPGMRFPIEDSPAFANSQVWGHGGMNGPGGGQCHDDNYSYPWWDNYCETRQWDMPLCPSGDGHQGQDIRPATCTDKQHWAVAAEAGSITHIGSYSVNLVTADGTRHRYLHMDPASVPVNVGDDVNRGDRLGLVSNAFGGTPTTIHLHYDIRQAVSGVGEVYVPTYMSLVTSYQDLIGEPAQPCGSIGSGGDIIDNQDDCFHLLGNLGTWRTEEAGYAGSLHWTYAYDGDQPDGYARWRLHFDEPGEYEVEAHIEGDYADSKQARYVVRAGGSDLEVQLDQSAGSGWRKLGEFEFVGDDDEWVEIYDNTGEPLSEQLRFVADALRLTAVEEEVEEEEEQEEEEVEEEEGQEEEEVEEQDEQEEGVEEEEVEDPIESDDVGEFVPDTGGAYVDAGLGPGGEVGEESTESFPQSAQPTVVHSRSTCSQTPISPSPFYLLAILAGIWVANRRRWRGRG